MAFNDDVKANSSLLDDSWRQFIPDSESDISHYGTPRHSGRYPWGSGKNPQRNRSFYSRVEELRKQGLSDTEIAKGFGISTTKFRAQMSNARAEVRADQVSRVRELKEHGYSNVEIGRRLGVNESTVRSLLNEHIETRQNLNRETAEVIKKFVDENRYVDIGAGTELNLGVTDNRKKNAVALLEEDGYKVQYVLVDQMGTNHKTTIQVLTPEDVSYNELKEHKYDIRALGEQKIQMPDGSIRPGSLDPVSIDSSRIKIRYNEEGGLEKDGTIELRRGVDDISLGKAQYVQARIAVDGQYYMKGMAFYGDDKDFPPGVDIIYNTNKHVGAPNDKVFKEMKDDPDNPFGASIKDEKSLIRAQRFYKDKDGNLKQSAINVVNEEGDWGEWSKSLASQFLSKQNVSLAKRQLDLAYAEKKAEFDEICALTNPTVKKKLLESFSDDCDASAVHLKAAALPRQASHVILPFNDLKDNEIYAPNYNEGERVVLIRYPHGGTFEIPELTVRNRGTQASKVIGNAIDAVGINKNVADKLSGADFDGDTALVIPVNSRVKIKTSKTLKGLEGFDPKEAYPFKKGMKIMTPDMKQKQMGMTTNLITDMTLKGATPDELARAVRHSMVVIDAEKHKLNYKQSEIDNGIAALKDKYQNNGDGKHGVSTLISRAKSPEMVDARKDYTLGPKSIYEDGRKKYTPTKETWTTTDRKGNTKVHVRKQESTRMAEADDAFTLTSGGSRANPGTQMEAVYADYANKMKALGNSARKEFVATPSLKYDPEAKKTYMTEVKSLNDKLNMALQNAPKERQAQLLANQIFEAKKQADPSMDKDHIKKAKGQALTTARARIGAKKQRVEITPSEWEAIQKGAISDSKLRSILNNADLDKVKQYATPKATSSISNANRTRAKAMSASGNYTTKEIADALGVSTSTINKIINDAA